MDTRRMIRFVLTGVAIVAMASAMTLRPAALMAQQPTPAGPAKPAIPLKIDVVISRWQAEKKVSSLPFALYIVAPPPGSNMGNQSVRMGVDVPVGTVSRTSNAQGGSGSTTTTGPEYRNVGTSIDGRAGQPEDGRFSIYVSVQDTSLFASDGSTSTQVRLADPMAFRTFTMNNTLTMRDGQTLPFAMATDKITGEIVKVDVTVTVLK